MKELENGKLILAEEIYQTFQGGYLHFQNVHGICQRSGRGHLHYLQLS